MRVLIAILLIALLVMTYFWIRDERHEDFIRNEKIQKDSITSDHYMKCRLVKENEYLSSSIDSSDIIFLGTSISESLPVTYLSNNIHLKNFAVAGALTEDLLHLTKGIVNRHPRKIFIEVGINDIRYKSLHEKDFEQNFSDSISKMLYVIKTYSPQTVIYIQSIFPIARAEYAPETDTLNIEIQRMNKMLAALAPKVGAMYLNTYELLQVNGKLPDSLSADGIHLKEQAYQKWYTFLQPYLN